MTAYTASMQSPYYPSKPLIASCGIALLSALTSGCYTPCGSYYREPVAYVPEVPRYYAPTYQYPAYSPALVSVNWPRWGACRPPAQPICNTPSPGCYHGYGQRSAYSRPAWNSYPPQSVPCRSTMAPPLPPPPCPQVVPTYSRPSYYSRPAGQNSWVNN